MIHAPDQFYEGRGARGREGPEPWLGKSCLRHITLQATLRREDAGARARFEDHALELTNWSPLWPRLEKTRTLHTAVFIVGRGLTD
jgi:hypothetical protein